MKIAFTGKGGVGKTTLAALFIQVLAQKEEVLAVDCDPDSNLARALGFPDADKIIPIVRMQEMINERMGVDKNNKSFFKLNPKIDDIPDKFSRDKGNIKLIVMGKVDAGGKGCMCPENTFVKNLVGHLILKRNEHIVMDMEAGLEHFGRGTAAACDFVLAVVEPSLNSIETAKNIAVIARDIGIKRVYALANKLRNGAEREFVEKHLGDIRLIETIDFDAGFLEWGRQEGSLDAPPGVSEKLGKLRQLLEEERD